MRPHKRKLSRSGSTTPKSKRRKVEQKQPQSNEEKQQEEHNEFLPPLEDQKDLVQYIDLQMIQVNNRDDIKTDEFVLNDLELEDFEDVLPQLNNIEDSNDINVRDLSVRVDDFPSESSVDENEFIESESEDSLENEDDIEELKQKAKNIRKNYRRLQTFHKKLKNKLKLLKAKVARYKKLEKYYKVHGILRPLALASVIITQKRQQKELQQANKELEQRKKKALTKKNQHSKKPKKKSNYY